MDRLVFFVCIFELVVGISLKSSSHGHQLRRSIGFLDSTPGRGREIPSDVGEWMMLNEQCRTKEITQNITSHGCEWKLIANKMCYGVCLSAHYPSDSASGSSVDDQPLELCNRCMPRPPKSQLNVSLKCSNGTTRIVTIKIIERCACTLCNA